MKLVSFRVRKFRNVVDSGLISVNDSVTCLVGKNEAGKSALLEALYLFNPAYSDVFNIEDQYPRWLLARDRRNGNPAEETPIEVTFKLDNEDLEAVSEVLGSDVLTNNELTIKRKYNGDEIWDFHWSELNAVTNLISDFPETVQSLATSIETLESLREALKANVSEERERAPRAEDLEIARKVIQDKGLENIGVWNRIVEILRTRCPKFFRFAQYSTLPGRINLKELAGAGEPDFGRTGLGAARALLRLVGTDLNQLKNDDYELRTAELEAVQIELTNQVFEYWKQNPSLEVVIDVDKMPVDRGNGRILVERFLDIRMRDKRTGYSNNFFQRSSGFQWFFSFFAAFSEFKNKESLIVLLDEPALNLHGKAQADFLRFIDDRLAKHSQVLYTTHSPFMVQPDKLDRVRIVEDKGPPFGAICSNEAMGNDPESLFPLQAALGYDIAQSLFVGPHNLVVEGLSDYIYLTIMSTKCTANGLEGLDSRWRIIPAGGATNIPTFVSLVGPHLDVTVVGDSNVKGMQRITNMINNKLLKSHRLIMANVASSSDHADIEDLFSEEDYLALYNNTFGTVLNASDLPPGSRIVKRIEALYGEFDHGRVAETLLREHNNMSFKNKTLDQFATLFSEINRTMDS